MLTGRLLILSKKEAECKEMTAYFEDSGYNVIWCTEYDEAGEILSRGKNKPDLLIFDVDIPKRREYETVEKIRMYSDMAILMLSQDDKLDSQLYAYSKKIDDYMVKPFLPKELSLRIGIILRRYYKGEDPIVQLAGSQIDFDRAEVIKENKHFPLTAKEHDILLALYRNAGRIVTIDQLCEAAWGDNPYGYENSLMAHIRRIREKIEANPSKPVSLITVKGLGYKLVLTGK